MSEIKNPVRDKATGWWTIYEGGHHITVCDGAEWHHKLFEGGDRELRAHRCDTWVGGCPALRMIARACKCVDSLDAVERYLAYGSEDPRNLEPLGVCHFCKQPAKGRDWCFGCKHLICAPCGGEEWISAPTQEEHDLEDHRWPTPAEGQVPA